MNSFVAENLYITGGWNIKKIAGIEKITGQIKNFIMFLLKGNNPNIDRTKVEIDIERNNKKSIDSFISDRIKLKKKNNNKNIKE